MKKLLLLLALCAALCARDFDKQVVINCKSADSKQFEKMLDTIAHLVEHYDKFSMSYDIVTVSQAECVRFMLKDINSTEYRGAEVSIDIEFKMEKLKGKARFEQCKATLERKKIPDSRIKKEVKLIPSASLALVDYQLKGYALLP